MSRGTLSWNVSDQGVRLDAGKGDDPGKSFDSELASAFVLAAMDEALCFFARTERRSVTSLLGALPVCFFRDFAFSWYELGSSLVSVQPFVLVVHDVLCRETELTLLLTSVLAIFASAGDILEIFFEQENISTLERTIDEVTNW
jgi:hypothetical protein